MDSRTQSHKQELVRQLAGYRSTLKVPDTRHLLSQSKNLLNVAGKLPATMNARPARTVMITAGAACLLVLLLKPKRKRKKNKTVIEKQSTLPGQLFAFTLSITQPLMRVWLTEQARRWLRK
ncbi:hypothetical protein [Roseibacillus persicicus]|uniref:Uncharacterized protein n=1 Tax=Roseibacillus persicicus TaxID=454148 RepID=A0A918TUG4_9BACT|nr:hypothetical protein [Roseibacillus persicicus]GHC62454.1 hypothetical protein GCM10007100_32340 [Roseibacillus persicicus]